MHLTNRQMFFFVCIYITTFAVCIVPKWMADTVGTNAWLFLLIAAAVYSIPAGIIAYLGYIYKEKTLFEYSQLLVGKFLTYCISFVYLLYFFIGIAILVRTTGEIIKAQLMVNTPIWAVMLLVFLTSGYAVSKGLSNIGRIVEFFGIIILIASILIHGLMFYQGDILNIQPFLDLSDHKQIIPFLPLTLYLFTGFEVITIIPFSKSNGIKAIGTIMLSLLTVGASYVIATETCFMVLGVDDISQYNYPLLVAVRRMDIQALQFLKRIDLIFFIAWIFGVFCSISVILTATIEYAKKIFSKANRNILLVVICVLSFIAGLLPKGDSAVDEIALNVSLYTAAFTTTVIPVSLLIVSKVKKHAK